MSRYPLVELGNPALRQIAAACPDPSSPEVHTLLSHMQATLDEARARTGHGRAIAAPQLGFALRVVLIDYASTRLELINPRFERWSREEDARYESCFSFPGLWGLVQRPRSVVISAWDPQGAELRIEASDTLARILQHEIDHLDGFVWLDRNPDLHSLCTTSEYERRYRTR